MVERLSPPFRDLAARIVPDASMQIVSAATTPLFPMKGR
jgi:hypothetical protein